MKPELGVGPDDNSVLRIRRNIRATPEFLFNAWTTPEALLKWWGPRGVRCTAAEVDLQVGGAYRLANQLPDGQTVWISGVFEQVEKFRLLVFTWQVEAAGVIQKNKERVTVTFQPDRVNSAVTEVCIVHERIGDGATRATHETGWEGCLDGLEVLAERGAEIFSEPVPDH